MGLGHSARRIRPAEITPRNRPEVEIKERWTRGPLLPCEREGHHSAREPCLFLATICGEKLAMAVFISPYPTRRLMVEKTPRTRKRDQARNSQPRRSRLHRAAAETTEPPPLESLTAPSRCAK